MNSEVNRAHIPDMSRCCSKIKTGLADVSSSAVEVGQTEALDLGVQWVTGRAWRESVGDYLCKVGKGRAVSKPVREFVFGVIRMNTVE